MQLTRHDGPGITASRKAANLLVRLVTRTLELRLYEGERLTADLPNLERSTLPHLEDDGVARIGIDVSPGMVLVGRVSPVRRAQDAEGETEDGAAVRDASLRCPPGLRGTIDSITMEDGAKKGDPRLIRVVVLSQYPLRLGDVLEADGRREVVTALTDDEDFELRWPGLEGAYDVTRVEPFAEDVLHARSIGPYSVVSEMPLSGREQFGGQRITAAQLDALLDRGAINTVRELLTVKSDDPPGRLQLYESIVLGKPQCVPTLPRRTRLLERLLLSLGFDVDLTSSAPRLEFLGSDALKALAPGEVKKPETINYRTFRPEREGLFCEQIFGAENTPERAVNLGRVELAVPLLHPLARKPVARLLGLSEPQLERILLSESSIDGRELDDDWRSSGPPALQAACLAKDPNAARFFAGAWPVLPPALRPLVPLDGGRFATSDLNDLYRRVINRNNRTRRLLELNAPTIIIRNEVRMLQESLDALCDNDSRAQPITGPSGEALVSLAGFLINDRGPLRTVEKVVDYSAIARAVLTANERVRLPASMAYELFKPWLYERMERAGQVTRIKEAKREIEARSANAAQALASHSERATLLLFTSTGAVPAGVQGFEVWDEPSIGIGARLAARLGLRPGDSLTVHVPIDPRAEKEVLGLETASVTAETRRGGWLERASRADNPLDVLLNAALAAERDELHSRLARLLLARLDGACPS